MATTPDNQQPLTVPDTEHQPPLEPALYKDLLERIIEGFALGELILDEQTGVISDFRVISVNPSAHKHFGIDLNEYLGKTIGETPLISEGRPFLEMLRKVQMGDQPYVIEGFHSNYNFWIRVRLLSLSGNQFAMLFENITQEKELEALRIKDAEMDKTRELMDLVIHDLKAPLTSLNIKLYLIQKSLDRLQGDEIALASANKNLQDAELIAQRMNRMMQNLTTYSRLDKETEITLTETNCGAFLQRLFVSEIQSLAELKKQCISLKVQGGEPMLAMLNEDYYSRIVMNLTSNAMRYTEEDGSINLALYADIENVILEVRDTGIGISIENLTKIFEPFFRVEGHLDMENGNAGLGLAAVKKLCELHNGKVEVESEESKGTLFRVRIPRLKK